MIIVSLVKTDRRFELQSSVESVGAPEAIGVAARRHQTDRGTDCRPPRSSWAFSNSDITSVGQADRR